jgi:hypothetical protein
MALTCRPGRLTVLDHHATAEAELKAAGTGLFDFTFNSKKSGGRLAWEHFFPDVAAPWLVTYTEDFDSCTWGLPGSREINAWPRSYPPTFEQWQAWHENLAFGSNLWQGCVNEGDAILRA